MLPIRKAASCLGVHAQTLRRWESEGKIIPHRTVAGQRRYDPKELDAFAIKTRKVEDDQRSKFIYCRVSSSKQSEDLDRQIAFMRGLYPGWEVISDIGSGAHYHRTGFRRLLELVLSDSVSAIAVAYKDRLGRFGLDLFEHICDQHGTAIIIEDHSAASPHDELVADVIAIITSFAARVHGLRKYIPKYRDLSKTSTQDEKGNGEDNPSMDGSSATIVQ